MLRKGNFRFVLFLPNHIFNCYRHTVKTKYAFNNKTMKRKMSCFKSDYGIFCCWASTALPPFGASVLEPSFDLGVCHLQSLGEGGSLGRRQIFLPVKAFLQLADLQPCERRPRFLLLRRRSVLVWMTYTTCHSEGWEGHWTTTDRTWQERIGHNRARKGKKTECEARMNLR